MKPNIPKLTLSFSPQDTWRKEDFQLPTSFRTTRREDEPDEKLTDQLDRLNEIVQFVMNRFETPDSSAEAAVDRPAAVCYRELLLMTLEDWAAHEARTDSQLFSTIDHVSCIMSPMKLLDFDFNEESRLRRSRGSKQLEDTRLQIFTAYVSRLRHDLGNLTSQTFIAVKEQPEVEFPLFCKQVLATVAELLTKEKSFAVVQEPHVKCSVEDLFDIRERLDDILNDLVQDCKGKQYQVQLGDIALYLEVEVAPHLSPEKTSSSRSVGQEPSKAEPEGFEYVSCLEAEVMELKAKLAASDHPDASMFITAQEGRVMDLELQVEALSEELKLAHQQVWALSRSNCSMEVSAIIEASEKSDTVKQLEELLLQELDSFKAEKAKLTEQAKQIEVQTSAVFQEHQAANEAVLQRLTADLGHYQANEAALNLRIQDLESQLKKAGSTKSSYIEMPLSAEMLKRRLSECYSQLENHDPQMGPPSVIRREIKEIRAKLDGLQLDLDDQCIENTDPIRKGVFSCKSQSLRTTLDYPSDLGTSPTSEHTRLTYERSELAKAKEDLEVEKARIDKQKAQLKEKIGRVNERQHKLVEREKLLTDKQTLLLLQEKKQDCHKQAIDEEWARIDEKRHDVLKCHRMMDEEWKALMEETRVFEQLKQNDRKSQTDLVAERQKLQRQLEDIETSRSELDIYKTQLQKSCDDIERQHKTLDRERRRIDQEREALSLEREKLQLHKREVFERLQEYSTAKQDCSFEGPRQQKKNRRNLSMLSRWGA
jgi:hypothetical protein